jgi:hypothetical protein
LSPRRQQGNVTTADTSRKITYELAPRAPPQTSISNLVSNRERTMSIVRIGLGETKNFAEGYEAIFGKKKDKQDEKKDEKTQSEQATAEQKKDEKK